MSNAFSMIRVFEAPKESVFEAWTNPEKLRKWWGPKDFTCPDLNMDLRVGGKYHASMQGPDGKKFWSTGTYKEIIPNEKLVMSDSFSDEHGNIVSGSDIGMPGDWPLEMEVTVTFHENEGKTTMTVTHVGIPLDQQKDCDIGWEQSFDKLEVALAS